MPDTGRFVAFCAASIALVVLPGPNLLHILTRAVTQGSRTALIAAAGVETATLLHITAAAFGLSALLAHSTVAFAVLKYAGAAYLVWLGTQALRTPWTAARPPHRAERLPSWRVYADGVLVNLLNPKVALFFLAFLPQFARPGAAARTDMLLLGAVFFLVALLADAGYALAGNTVGRWLRARPKVLERQHYVVGATHFVLAGAALLS